MTLPECESVKSDKRDGGIIPNGIHQPISEA